VEVLEEVAQIANAVDADELRPLALDRRHLASDVPPVPAAIVQERGV
jgi:hypothetical protein